MEEKAYRVRVWKMMRKEPYLRGMCEHFSSERSKAKKFRQLADEEKQAGIQGQWQSESPAKEYLEQVKRRDDTYCTENDEERLYRPEKWRLGKYEGIFRFEVKATE